jgi:hypothetical protein
MNMHIFFAKKILQGLNLVILYNVIMHKCIFGQADCQDLLKSIPKNFTLYFSEFYMTYHEFSNFKDFLEFKSQKDF